MNPIDKQLNEYYTFCTEVKRFSPRTMSTKKCSVGKFVRFSGITDLSQITNRQINGWIASMSERGVAGRSINGYLAQLVVTLKWERDNGVAMPDLKISQIAQAKMVPSRRVSYTAEEIETVLKCADAKAELMIRLCFDCGLRISELTNIKLEDVKGRSIRIVGKGSKERIVYMGKRTKKLMARWVKKNHLTKYLWPSSVFKNTPECRDRVKQAMKEAFTQAGFNDFYPHALRHSFASDMYRNGAPIRIIQKALGHSSQMTTERYLDSIGQNELARSWEVYKYHNRGGLLRGRKNR